MRERGSRVNANAPLRTLTAREPANDFQPEKRKMIGEGTTDSSETAHPLISKVLGAKPPIAELIGFDVEEIGDGRAVGSLQAGPQHANPMGTVHGGVLCDVADAAMGMAFASTLAPDESFTTIALSINFFRPVWRSRLRAEARVINRGKTVGYLECEVTDEDGKLVAKANSTCFVLRGEQVRGR
jgi:uncharacterized protein (TIGR00369 family)